MAPLCPEDSKNVAYMCLEKQNTHQDSGILYPTCKHLLELPDMFSKL